MSVPKVELGRRLFYDADLSVDGTLSCATCHEQKHGFAETNRSHPGVTGQAGRRNVPGLANVGYFRTLTWADPTQRSLERQVATPVLGTHPVEMGMAGQEVELARRLSADRCYRRQFAEAFPDGRIDFTNVSKALAAFERTLISRDSLYDRGDLTDAARRGQALVKARCQTCHAGPNFTDATFHVLGAGTPADRGAVEITSKPAHEGAFRTPSLRNIALGPPYLHDGSAPDLAAAVARHYDGGRLKGRAPTAPEQADLTAFIEALTDRAFTTDPRFSLPKPGC